MFYCRNDIANGYYLPDFQKNVKPKSFPKKTCSASLEKTLQTIPFFMFLQMFKEKDGSYKVGPGPLF